MLKETLILTTLLFLLVAPTPDSRDIAEMTADFLVPMNRSVLLTSDKPDHINVDKPAIRIHTSLV